MLNFKPTFSLSSFTFIKRLFSSSSLSAIRVVRESQQGKLLSSTHFLYDRLAARCFIFRGWFNLHSNLQKENIPLPFIEEKTEVLRMKYLSQGPRVVVRLAVFPKAFLLCHLSQLLFFNYKFKHPYR